MKWRREKLEPEEEFPIIMELSLEPNTHYMTFMVHWPTGGGYSWRSNLKAFLQSWEKQCHVASFDVELLEYLIEEGSEEFPLEDLAPTISQNWSQIPTNNDLQQLYRSANTATLNTDQAIQISEDVSFTINNNGLEFELLFTADGQLLNRYKPELLSPECLIYEHHLYVFRKQLYLFNRHGERVHEPKNWGIEVGWIEIKGIRQQQNRLIAHYHNKIKGPRSPFIETFNILGKQGWFEFSATGIPLSLCPAT